MPPLPLVEVHAAHRCGRGDPGRRVRVVQCPAAGALHASSERFTSRRVARCRLFGVCLPTSVRRDHVRWYAAIVGLGDPVADSGLGFDDWWVAEFAA